MPAPVTKAIASEPPSAMSRSTGSTGSLIGWPLIRIGTPVSSPSRGGLSATYAPYSTRNVTAAKTENTAACTFSVVQNTSTYPSESNHSDST